MAPDSPTAVSKPSFSSSFEYNTHDRDASPPEISTQGTRLKGPHPNNVTAKHEVLFKRFHRFGHWAHIAGIISTIVSGIFALAMEVIMLYVIWTFYKTKDIPISGRPWGPWAKRSVVWPTFMLAVAALVTTILAIAQLIALCNRAKRVEKFFGIYYQILHVVAWIVVSVVYVVEKTDKDLWGWSCTKKAKAIEDELGSNDLNFKTLCTIQGGSWVVSIFEIVVKVIIAAVVAYCNYEEESLKGSIAGDIGSFAFERMGG